MLISIEDYDRHERDALGSLSNRAIQAFRPATFSFVSYPDRVYSESEVIRYVDTMHETKQAIYFTSHDFSVDEAALVKGISDDVVNLTAKRFGSPKRPWMSPLAALNLFRSISAMAQRAGRASVSVFEIGPGSGYLGALLIKTGHRYASMDNAQAFYLWQNRLYDNLASDDFVEMASSEMGAGDFGDNRAAHIPWWEYCRFHETEHPIAADIVVCDHALGELSRNALKYILRTSQKMLSRSTLGLFLFQSPGKTHISSMEAILNEFRAAGFVPVMSKRLWGFAVKESELGRFALSDYELPSGAVIEKLMRKFKRDVLHPFSGKGTRPAVLGLDVDIPYYNPSGNPKKLKAYDFLPVLQEEAARDYCFLSFIGDVIPGSRPKPANEDQPPKRQR
jgi:hypothetical protein